MIDSSNTTAELLSSNEDIELLFDIITPCNVINAKEIQSLINHPYQNVMDLMGALQSGDVLQAVCIATNQKQKKILKSNCNEFLCFLKYVTEEVKLITNLLNSLSVDTFDEDSMMLQASGIEKLNRYNEIMVYYNIDKNPTAWKAIGELPFATIFTKLSIDKDMNEIQKNYNKMISQKK